MTPRADALPEHMQYRDDGCSVAPRCLECPLPRCRYDMPGGIRALRLRARDRRIAERRARGEEVQAIAEAEGISARNVWRILRERRAGAAQEMRRIG